MEYYVLKHDRDKEAGRELSHGEQAIERYGGDIDLSGTFLSKKLVEDVFVKGIINYLERYESISTQAPISLIRKLNLHGVLFGTTPSEQRRSSRKLTIKWNNNFERETLFIQLSCCKFSDYAATLKNESFKKGARPRSYRRARNMLMSYTPQRNLNLFKLIKTRIRYRGEGMVGWAFMKKTQMN